MPELPEVETVRRGLEPYVTGATIENVELRRPDLRFPLPSGFAAALTGTRINGIDRRAKYLLLRLSSGLTWLSHLGMTGAWRFRDFRFKEASRYYEPTDRGEEKRIGERLAEIRRRLRGDDGANGGSGAGGERSGRTG